MINLYSIKDMKGDFSEAVYSFSNDDCCRRAVSFLPANNELYKRYPEDFVVYRIGQFDFTSGNIVPENTPVYICDLTYGGKANEDMA